MNKIFIDAEEKYVGSIRVYYSYNASLRKNFAYYDEELTKPIYRDEFSDILSKARVFLCETDTDGTLALYEINAFVDIPDDDYAWASSIWKDVTSTKASDSISLYFHNRETDAEPMLLSEELEEDENDEANS